MRKLILAILVCLTISFVSPANAEIIYIQIPIEAQEKYTAAGFVADYLATTGEVFVLGNMREEKGENQMTGSSRITWEQCNTELKARWPMISCYRQTGKELPTGWVKKGEAE